MSGYASAVHRLQLDENYDGWKFTGDVIKETGNIKGAGGTALAVTAALGISVGAGSMASVLVFASAVIGGINLTAKLSEAYLPRLHKKITGKF